jgi:hypothetical protein
MLINLSNHPSDKWDSHQISEAKKHFGTITDMEFPAINPTWDAGKIKHLAHVFFGKITSVFDECANQPFLNAVHIQGEFTFVYNLVNLLKNSDITCVASTSMRNVEELPGGQKIVKFQFVRFREY